MAQDSSADPSLLFRSKAAWAGWLELNHRTSPGVWLRLAKKSSGKSSVTYAEALDVALCHGWIDAKKQRHDAHYFLQRFTRRTAKSIWSKINREKALALIAQGDMKPAGLEEIERAKADGRWNAAYDSSATATVPDDLQAALDRNRKAKAFFATLNRLNRYAILFRIHTARKAETRARRIETFVAMLERHETLYP